MSDRYADRPTLRRAWAALALGCCLLGVGLRFSALDRQPLWLDESVTRLRAFGSSWHQLARSLQASRRWTNARLHAEHFVLRPERGMRDVIESSREDPHISPFYYLLVHGWLQLFGSSTHALRSLSAVLGILLLPVLHALGRELFRDRRIAAVLMALAALSPIHVRLRFAGNWQPSATRR